MLYHLGRLAGGEDLSRVTLTLNEQITGPTRRGKRISEIRLPTENIPLDGETDIRPTGIKILGRGAIRRVYPGLEEHLTEEEMVEAIAENPDFANEFDVYIGGVRIQPTGHLVYGIVKESASDILRDTREATEMIDVLADHYNIPQRDSWNRNFVADLTGGYFPNVRDPDLAAAMDISKSTALEISRTAIRSGLLVNLGALQPFEHGSMAK